MIGIDAPEIASRGKASQAFADRAREYLAGLTRRRKIMAVFGIDRTDRYGRTLAHIFLDDGTNLQARLLHRGLATRLTIPPNVRYTACYQRHEQLARQARRGIWSVTPPLLKAGSSLSSEQRGYRIVTGRVSALKRTGWSLWLVLEDRLFVRIARPDWQYFELPRLAAVKGKEIIVSGELYKYRGQLRMRVRHPSHLQLASR